MPVQRGFCISLWHHIQMNKQLAIKSRPVPEERGFFLSHFDGGQWRAEKTGRGADEAVALNIQRNYI